MKKKKNIFIRIWSSPRAAIKEALTTMSFWQIALLGFLGAWGTTITLNFDAANIGDYLEESSAANYEMPSLLSELLLSFLGAIATLFIATAFMALLYWVCGKLFKGTGTFMDLYKGTILTFVPLSIIPFLTIIWLVISPETFYGVTEETSVLGGIMMALAMAIMFLTIVYTLVATIVMVSEVHQFSKWRAFFTIAIPSVLLTIVLVIIILVIAAFVVAFFV